VAGETPSTRLASERPTQSGSRDAERVTKPTQIYQNIADSLTIPRSHDLQLGCEYVEETEVDNWIQALVKGDTESTAIGKAIQAIAQGLRSSGRSYYP
jgi:hypothetical protein